MKAYTVVSTATLSSYQLLSLNSFILQGYEVIVYTDRVVDNVPESVEIREFLIEHKRIDPLEFGLKVLIGEGGLWFDTSVYCNRYLDVADEHVFYGNKVIKAPKHSWLLKIILMEGIEFLYDKPELTSMILDNKGYFLPISPVTTDLMSRGDNGLVSTLWNKDTLGPLELLTINTLKHFGHKVVLYSTVPKIHNVPEGIEVQNVTRVATTFFITEFNHQSAIHSVKYRALKKTGGWWVDMGVIILKPLYSDRDHLMCRNITDGYSSHVMKAPKDSWICDDLIAICSQMIHEGGGCMNEHNNDICSIYLHERPELDSIVEPLSQVDPIHPENMDSVLMSDQVPNSTCIFMRSYPNVDITEGTLIHKLIVDSCS